MSVVRSCCSTISVECNEVADHQAGWCRVEGTRVSLVQSSPLHRLLAEAERLCAFPSQLQCRYVSTPARHG